MSVKLSEELERQVESLGSTRATSLSVYTVVATAEGEASLSDAANVDFDTPNVETTRAIEDARAGRVLSFDSMEDLFKDLRS